MTSRENCFSLFCPTWRGVFKMFARLFRIEQVKASRKVKQEVFTNKKTRKRRDQLSVLIYLKMPKLEKIINRFQVAVRLFSNRSQKTSNCGKNISDTLACGSCATFLFLPHFDVICDLLLNRRTATWNLFVK